MRKRFSKFLTALAFATMSAVPAAHAGTLTITADGAALGFTLSTFATLNPTYTNTFNFGPFGVAMDTTGGTNTVLVNNYATNTRYVFDNVDGQTTATAINTVTNSGSGTIAYATAGGVAYGGVSGNGGKFVQFNKDGTVNHVLTGVAYNGYLGMWGAPNGHIIASTNGGQLIDIDPLANGGLGSARLIATPGFMDGVSVSPDGTKAIIELGGTIRVYDIATGALTATYSNALLSGVDGTGVIASNNSLNGDIVAVTNYGTVVLIDPNGFNDLGVTEYKLIATGGSRGDYASPDVTNGSLFIDMSEAVYRLACGAGCGIGTDVGGDVPEPVSLALVAVGLVGVAGSRRRRPISIAA